MVKSSSTRARTWNLAVNSRSLCQLSYRGRRAGLYVQGRGVSSTCHCEPPLVEYPAGFSRDVSRPPAAKQSHVTFQRLFDEARRLPRDAWSRYAARPCGARGTRPTFSLTLSLSLPPSGVLREGEGTWQLNTLSRSTGAVCLRGGWRRSGGRCRSARARRVNRW